MNKGVHFILTGGTIDSVFDPSADSIIVNDHSVIASFIDTEIHPHINITYETLTLKDSREITNNIREEIIKSITKSTAKAIIITHGTYTMPETAMFLQKHLEQIDKTIILTGSMKPLKGFSDGDAPFNLGFALSSAQLLKAGVYLAMNSHIFHADEVTKDTDKGIFIYK